MMKWHLWSCFLVLLLGHCCCGEEVTLLVRTLHALTRSLNYFQEHVAEINVDAVFCARQVQEQLESFLEFEPDVFRSVRHWLEVLRDKAKQVADQGTHHVYITAPRYAQLVGAMTNESKKLAWYPSQVTSLDHTDQPVTCPDYFYEETTMNLCYNQATGGRGVVCGVGPECYVLNTKWNLRDFALTHQVLYWEKMEGLGCVESVPSDHRLRFCSNVMRDAERIAEAGFPHTHTDLFMEQVGLCGFWGFKDFNRPDWLEKILELQDPSGCYRIDKYYYCFDKMSDVPLKREKRRENILKDGCLAHKTAVAMIALVVNVRFEAEKIYLRRNETTNELNALLDGTQVSA